MSALKIGKYLTSLCLMMTVIVFGGRLVYPGTSPRRSATTIEREEALADTDKWDLAIEAADIEWHRTIHHLPGGQSKPGDPRSTITEDNYARTQDELRAKHISEDYFGVPWSRSGKVEDPELRAYRDSLKDMFSEARRASARPSN